MNDLKYLSAYTIPVVGLLGITLQGYWSFATPIYAFGIIPILELLLPLDTDNLSEEERTEKLSNPLFDWLLYLNVPLVFGIIIYSLFILTTSPLVIYEIVGMVFSVGIVLGYAINVAHELGHRKKAFERFLGKLLLLPSHYMHFYIEHNFGHHQMAATKEDPATAKYNQTVYSFWITSVFRQYLSAWKIQKQLLKRDQRSFFSIKNDMLWYSIFQLSYLFVIYQFFDLKGLLFALAIGIVGFLLLETINYIEHYGLVRKKMNSGRYERVREIHSWNSNHVIGRVVLYELTRHSDHHYRAAKKYQILDYHDISPQMPFGYPTSMVMSLIPPLWFGVMNKRVPQEMKEAA
ncbi:alkane 1-monooxygenase [Sungkyunkwania multivorans]|uniref:Alkane 1-monooxygenase n=1 Tax=Sungkyunkwania multivorans TaxID=1173618 RepID=A0ABW3D293_9FLAO